MERINRYFPLGQLTLLAVNPDTWSDVIANEIARIILDNEDAVHYYSIRLSAKEFIHREQKQRSHRDSIFAKRFTLDDSRDKDIDCLCRDIESKTVTTVIIDNLQLIGLSANNWKEHLYKASTTLDALAKKLNIRIIALTLINSFSSRFTQYSSNSALELFDWDFIKERLVYTSIYRFDSPEYIHWYFFTTIESKILSEIEEYLEKGRNIINSDDFSFIKEMIDLCRKYERHLSGRKNNEEKNMEEQRKINIVELTPVEEEFFNHICELGLKEKKKAIRRLSSLKDIQFVGKIEGENTIGHIKDHDKIIQVSYLRDNLGSYFELSSVTEEIENVENAASYLSRWFVNGRYEICGNTIRVLSIFPILDEYMQDDSFLYKQISHALLELWDMNNAMGHE